MKIGVIADDLTGATDAASFIAQAGLATVQVQSPEFVRKVDGTAEAIVVGLKVRSIPAPEAVSIVLKAADELVLAGCQLLLYKICSTFDSTADGNIGPVLEALATKLDVNLVPIVPALPVNGRTVYQGYLFVYDQLLAESGMRFHPINPMLDSKICRLLEEQSSFKATEIHLPDVKLGASHLRDVFSAIEDKHRFVIFDTIDEENLDVIAHAVKHSALVCGGSGISGALARSFGKSETDKSLTGKAASLTPTGGASVILSGSLSDATNMQVECYGRAGAPVVTVDFDALFANPVGYANAIANTIPKNSNLAPIVATTIRPDRRAELTEKYPPSKLSVAVESFFRELASALDRLGFDNFIVAGGETSGAVMSALGAETLRIGPPIAPGVPWMQCMDTGRCFALKSGNFGSEDFFMQAQEILNTRKEHDG